MSVEVLSPECVLVASASVRRSGGNTAGLGGEADIQGHRSTDANEPEGDIWGIVHSWALEYKSRQDSVSRYYAR
jgi:hypothetical protein